MKSSFTGDQGGQWLTLSRVFRSQRKSYRTRLAAARSGEITGNDMTLPHLPASDLPHTLVFVQSRCSLLWFQRHIDLVVETTGLTRLPSWDGEETAGCRTITESIPWRKWHGQTFDLQRGSRSLHGNINSWTKLCTYLICGRKSGATVPTPPLITASARTVIEAMYQRHWAA